jgi:hypothetical protein
MNYPRLISNKCARPGRSLETEMTRYSVKSQIQSSERKVLQALSQVTPGRVLVRIDLRPSARNGVENNVNRKMFRQHD